MIKNKIINIPFKSKSQAWQDMFAYTICGDNKKTYIEIGAAKPVHKSNTYNLETVLGWKGFSIEIDQKMQQAWNECPDRKNKIFWADALKFDYAATVNHLNLPNFVGYLSCDIEPPVNTFAALRRVIEQGIVFRCITFEHDNYRKKSSDGTDYDTVAREYLVSKGYKVAVTGVYCKNPVCEFETWFVHKDINFEETTFDKWKASLQEKK